MAALSATAPIGLHAAGPCRKSAPQAGSRATASLATPRRPAGAQPRRNSRPSSSSPRSLVVAAAAQAEGVGKLISKVEIPAFIPRSDLLDQLLRWSIIEVQENGVANVGNPCKVSMFKKGDGEVWGFTVAFLKDGASAADIRVAFDEEVVLKHDWVGRGADGMPTLEGNAEEILGKNLEIRKVCDSTISEHVRSSIKDFCQLLMASVNRYYAFGSCFVDDST